MPARVIRESILRSDRFLSLSDNTPRVCYVVCLLTADDRGNMEASPGQLVRMWRDFGVDSTAKANAVSELLVDADLVRMYQVGPKLYLHIPRFGQRLRHTTRACPLSPWCKSTEKQQDELENDCRTPDARLTHDSLAPAEVRGGEVNGGEEVRTVAKATVAKTALSPCPHREIIEAYHELVPSGRRVNLELWNGTRQKHLQTRWRESPKRQSIEFWQRLFAYITDSAFLTGRTMPAPGRKPFEISLDWIVAPTNFAKIIEGAYHND